MESNRQQASLELHTKFILSKLEPQVILNMSIDMPHNYKCKYKMLAGSSQGFASGLFGIRSRSLLKSRRISGRLYEIRVHPIQSLHNGSSQSAGKTLNKIVWPFPAFWLTWLIVMSDVIVLTSCLDLISSSTGGNGDGNSYPCQHSTNSIYRYLSLLLLVSTHSAQKPGFDV